MAGLSGVDIPEFQIHHTRAWMWSCRKTWESVVTRDELQASVTRCYDLTFYVMNHVTLLKDIGTQIHLLNDHTVYSEGSANGRTYRDRLYRSVDSKLDGVDQSLGQ